VETVLLFKKDLLMHIGDIQSKRLILLKGVLFLMLGAMALGMLIALTQSWSVAGLALISIWAFCRFYYFMFYVIEKYVDGEFRYAGVGSFLAWWVARRRNGQK
jgi:hypothetical protein